MRLFKLNKAKEFENIESIDGVSIENGEIHIKRLEKDTQEEARDYRLSLYELIPRVKLTDFLMEVANWTKFDE